MSEDICSFEQIKIESFECDSTELDPTEISEKSQSQSAIDQKIVTKMEKLFECSTIKAIELYIALRRPDLDDLKIFGKNLKWLRSNNVTMITIIDNCKILLITFGMSINHEH